MLVDARQHHVEDVAAHVVEIHVRALGAVRFQSIPHAAALDARNLADGLAHCASGPGDHHGLSDLWLSDLQQTEIGGHARHAQRVEPFLRSAEARVDLVELGALRILHQAVFLDAEAAGNHVAQRERSVPQGNDVADTDGAHDFANAYRRDIAAAFIHPAAHRRVERQLQHLDQHLSVSGINDRLGRELSVGCLGQADGSCG